VRIALLIPGRFHGFDLGRALLAEGHEVGIFTNYPGWAVARFGFPSDRVTSFALHGAAERVAMRATRHRPSAYPESTMMPLFGRWAARAVRRQPWDVVHAWSGAALELLREPSRPPVLLMRGSSHIAVQDRLLAEECDRTGMVLERPSAWMVRRELDEYALADRVLVLSSFAAATFVASGVPESRLSVVPLGVDVEAFRAPGAALAARRERIRSGRPLTVLYVGALSYRKGLFDLERVIDTLAGERFEFVLAGPATAEASSAIARLHTKAAILGKRPQHDLPAVYAAADVFVFPTIEDGFAMVLTQAKASGLPIVTTPNSAGPDLMHDGRDGWIVPIRRPDAIVDRLRWCDANRAALADVADDVAARYRPQDWRDVAPAFVRACQDMRPEMTEHTRG
jgi:glycosyltransferase involved in cell wall biosynthesis